jgi:hypothetical protein
MPIVASKMKQKIVGVVTLIIIFTILGSLIIFKQPSSPNFAVYEKQVHEIFEDAKIQFEHIRGVTLPSNITISIYTKQQAIDRWGKEPFNLDGDSNILRQENIYKSLFLIGENESLRNATADWVADWTAVTVDHEIYVIYENFWPWDMPNAEAILIHELTHVWQTGLPKPASYDNDKAQSALLEGDASYMADCYKTLYNNNNNGNSNSTIFNTQNNKYYPRPTSTLSALLYTQKIDFVYSKVPKTVTSLNLFPYIQGKTFVSALIDNYADSNWSRLNQCYTSPYTPRTTTQILHPNKYFTGEITKNPTTPTLTTDSWIITPSKYGYPSNTYGEYFIYVMLNNWLTDDNQAQKAATGWNGDTFTYYEKDNDFLFTWNINWNSTQDASEFSQAFTDMLKLTQAKPQGNNNNQWIANNRYLTLTWNPNTTTTLIICSTSQTATNPSFLAK